jgi:peroxiredoxin/YHS domain-containing protein
VQAIVRVLLASLVLVAVLLPATLAAAAPTRALCLVCKVKQGEAEEEPVRAVRTHAGVEYGFCSEKCAQEFDADPAAYVPTGLPRPVPAFALTDLSGKPISPAALAGQVVLLDFWATWCAPCRKSMPELQALHDRYRDRGFTVVGVSIDEDGPAKVKKYVRAKKITYPIALDSGKDPAWEAFKVKAVPAAFLIDRQGQLVAQWTGAAATRAELERALEKLLAVD